MKKQLKGCLSVVVPRRGKKQQKQQAPPAAVADMEQLRSFFREVDKETLLEESESEISAHIASNDGGGASQTEVSSQPSTRQPLATITEEPSPDQRPEKQQAGSTSHSKQKGKQVLYSRRSGARKSPSINKENDAGPSERRSDLR